MKKGSLPIIAGIFIVLLVIYAIIELSGDESQKGSFKQQLIEIDTSEVNKITINKNMEGAEKVVLERVGHDWRLLLADGRKVSTGAGDAEQALAGIVQLKAKRLASKNIEDWSQYQVDSTGTRVRLYKNEEKLVDVVIGKFAYKSQYDMFTYFRLFDRKEVYPTPGFIGMNFNPEIHNWRNNDVLRINKDTVQTIKLEMADSSFVITRNDNQQWYIDEQIADSAKVQQYLNSLVYVQDRNFIDKLSGRLNQPVMSLVIYGISGKSTNLFVHMDPDEGLILTGNYNPDNSVFGNQDGLIGKLFKAKNHFLND